MTTTVGRLASSADRGGMRLLDDKLAVPAIGLTVSRRVRVNELLDRAAGHRVAVITGPAGAGKTVACAAWVRGLRPGRRAGWLTLDPDDRDPARFWRYFTLALAQTGAISAADAETIGQNEAPPQAILAAIAAAPPVPAIVVLDDVHVLAGSDVLAGLDHLIHHGPPTLTLVLTGRYVPGLALAKLRLAGQVGDIGATDLDCTRDEADAYLDSIQPDMPRAVRAAIIEQAEGWIAGLRLVSMTAPADVTGRRGGAWSDDLAWHHQLITDYVCDEILDALPVRSRQFLLRTCLTDVVTADLAQQVTGDPGAAALLERLSREIGLLRPAGPGQDGYQYHPMFRSVLEAVLRREHPGEVPSLLGQIARWQAGRKDVLAAVRAAVLAGDWDFGLQALREASPLGPSAAIWADLETVLSAFPENLRSDDATLACALAAARLWLGDPDGALPHLDCAARALARPDSEQDPTSLWLAALQVMRLAGMGGDLAVQRELADKAHEESARVPAHRATGLLWLALGCASIGELDMQRARAELQHACSQLAAGGLIEARERAKCWEAVALACYGDLARATRIAAEVAEGLAGRASDLAPILAISQASVHVARDEPEAAAMLLDQADQAVAGPQPAGEPDLRLLTGLLRTRIAIDEGNLAGARGLVRLMTEQVGPESPAATAVTVRDVEISLAAGERERARATLGALSQAAQSAEGTGAWPQAAVCEARLMAADDDDKGALKLLDPVISQPAVAARPVDAHPVPLSVRLTALLTAVVAHRRLNQAGDAAQRLEEALALAEPDDQYGPFISGGLPVRSALTVLITPASRCASFAARILDRFDGRMPRGTSQPSGAPLTESEVAVLRFLPSHMTNQEIAESLFLSINTIKTHLSSVYRKLGVTSRRQAIAQARRLDLLLSASTKIPLHSRCQLSAPAVQRNLGPGRTTAPTGMANVARTERRRGPHLWPPPRLPL
jgi:LuxR family transcriptional regulator, maltose regulon positive regulatory protein